MEPGITVSEKKTVHSAVYHHLSQLSVNIQVSELNKFSDDLGVQMQLAQLNFCLLD